MNKKITARRAAFDALLRVERDSAYSNLALDTVLTDSGLSAKDRAFASMLVYGVLERKLLLDYNLSRYSERNIRTLSPEVLAILRMGLFQIHFADSVPARAAVDESVRLCKETGESKASGFVNAVLRAASCAGSLCLPDRRRGKNKYLSIKYSCPEAIISLWRSAYGDELCEEILESLAGAAPVCIRVNTIKTDAGRLKAALEDENVSVKQNALLKNVLEIAAFGDMESLQLYKDGTFHVQDTASGICCGALGARPGMTVIDVCSAPGGKTFTIAEQMENSGSITACDLYEHLLRLVEGGAKRLGIDIIHTLPGDCRSAELPQADRILCDVPCSGLGIIRRKPELRYKEDTGDKTLPQLQYEILCSAAGRLRSGGILVYSTCTLNPAENGDNIRRFLSAHPDFEAAELTLPQGVERKIDEPANELTLFPGAYGTDGFFISAVRRK